MTIKNFYKVLGILMFCEFFVISVVIAFDFIIWGLTNVSIFGDDLIFLMVIHLSLILVVHITYLFYIYFVHPNDKLFKKFIIGTEKFLGRKK